MKTLMTCLLLLSPLSQAQPPVGPVGPIKPVEVAEQRTPFQLRLRVQVSGVNQHECFNVPEDRWLILQMISATMNSTTPRDAIQLTIETEAQPLIAGGLGFGHYFYLTPQVTLPNPAAGRRFAFTDTATIYSSPGSEVCVDLNRLGFGNPETGIVTLDGVLTDRP